MAVKTPKDPEEMRKQLTEQVQRFTAPRQGGGTVPPTPGRARVDLPTLIREARASLDAAVRQRDDLLRQAELRVERRRQAVATLEDELKRNQAQTAPAPAPAPHDPRPPVRKHR